MLYFTANDACLRNVREVSERDVVDDRAQHQQALALAVLGQHRESLADRRAGRPSAQRDTAELDAPGRGSVRSEDRAGDFRATAAQHPGEANDLSSAALQGD